MTGGATRRHAGVVHRPGGWKSTGAGLGGGVA